MSKHDGDSRKIAVPGKLPPHPRLFLNAKELKELKKECARDPWAGRIADKIVAGARRTLKRKLDVGPGKTEPWAAPTRDLAMAWHLTGERAFAGKTAEILVAYARVCPTLERTLVAGVLTSAALGEGEVVTDLAWAYDMVCPAGVFSASEKKSIEKDLFSRVGWDAGHRCNHMNSGNWRARALITIAAAGFASGDRKLMTEAVNGAYDPERHAWLYGCAQDISHAICSDGCVWERMVGYSYVTTEAMCRIAAMIRPCGVNLWTTTLQTLKRLPARAWQEELGAPGPRRLDYALDMFMYRTYPDRSVARVGNSSSMKIEARVDMYDAAYRDLPDPRYAWLINWHRRKKGKGDTKDPQRRGKTIWDLALAARKLPKGRFSFADDTNIGITGRHRNGCTLFPDGGFALLRGDCDSTKATCLEMHFGPYGSGHDHPDKLHVSLYGLGGELAPDAGSWGYQRPMQLGWGTQTIAHNTVTIDRVSQYPQENSPFEWEGERPGRTSDGRHVFFFAGRKLKAVRAVSDSVYEGCLLDRTLILLDPFLVDIYRVICDRPRMIDWAWHAFGKAKSSLKLVPRKKTPGREYGYRLLDKMREEKSEASWTVDWKLGGRSLRMAQVGRPRTAHMLGPCPSLEDEGQYMALSRRRVKETMFLSAFEPYRKESKLVSFNPVAGLSPAVTGLALEHRQGRHLLFLRHEPGEIRFGDISTTGHLLWCEEDSRGRIRAADAAGAGTIRAGGRRVRPTGETFERK